jgi:uncharacterized protein
MIPAFRVVVAGEDVSGRIGDRLLSLTVTDEDGEKADRVEIEVDDRGGRVALPDLDAQLQVALGYRGAPLAAMGTFAVDGLSGSHPAQTMRITATAADLKGPIRAPRTRAWEGKTLREIVATVAGEVGLRPLISASIAATRWDYVAQTAESNLHFLTRIAKTLDATAKAGGGALILQRRGDGLTAAGDALVPPVLRPSMLSDWSWDLDTREIYRCVEAEWCDVGGGQVQVVRQGSGDPVLRIRHVHASAEEANRAASAKLSTAARSAMTINATVAGFAPGLLAGASATLAGMSRPELDGAWHLQTVTHRLTGSGLTTSFKGKKGAPE